MEVEFMLIADAVEAVNGKLYIMGGCWDRHTANAYPATVKLGQAVALKVSLADTGHRKVGFKSLTIQEHWWFRKFLRISIQEKAGREELSSVLTGSSNLYIRVEVRVGDEVSDSVSFESNIALSN